MTTNRRTASLTVRPDEAPVWGAAYAAAFFGRELAELPRDERREEAAMEADIAVEVFRQRRRA